MDFEYEIVPYVSVNGFVFGKSRAEVKKACGVPYASTTDNIQKFVTEQREGCELTYRKGKLVDVILNKDVAPFVNGVGIYAQGGIEKLKEIDPGYLAGNRYIVFRGLGICVGGFSKKKIPEGKLVIAFSQDQTGFYEFFAQE